MIGISCFTGHAVEPCNRRLGRDLNHWAIREALHKALQQLHGPSLEEEFDSMTELFDQEDTIKMYPASILAGSYGLPQFHIELRE